MLTDSDFIAMNAIYLKKMATAATIAEVTGLPADSVTERLAVAAEQGWIMNLPTGAMLLDDGMQQVLDYYRERYSPIRSDPALEKWYRGFEESNVRFIAAVSEWQTSEGDERIERRLLQIAERLAKDIGQLQRQIERYASYVQRFERSMERVDAGERDFVCKPTIDSVHNIWFEFHEDILAVLGRPRDTT